MVQERKFDAKKVDTKEFELPDTLYVRDIENRVFQAIVLQCLSTIDGISLMEGNFIDNILGRENHDGIKGISIDQDNKNHSVSIKVDVNIVYGISIPEKADEMHSKIAEEVTKYTGIHVSGVHIVFKNVITLEEQAKIQRSFKSPEVFETNREEPEEYNDKF